MATRAPHLGLAPASARPRAATEAPQRAGAVPPPRGPDGPAHRGPRPRPARMAPPTPAPRARRGGGGAVSETLYWKSTKWPRGAVPSDSRPAARPGAARARPRRRPGPESRSAHGGGLEELQEVLVLGVDEVRRLVPGVRGGVQAGPEGDEVPAGQRRGLSRRGSLGLPQPRCRGPAGPEPAGRGALPGAAPGRVRGSRGRAARGPRRGLTWRCRRGRRCRPCAGASTRPRPSGGCRRRI